MGDKSNKPIRSTRHVCKVNIHGAEIHTMVGMTGKKSVLLVDKEYSGGVIEFAITWLRDRKRRGKPIIGLCIECLQGSSCGRVTVEDNGDLTVNF